MRLLLLTFFITTSFTLVAQPSVDEIVDTYFENIGGKDAWRGIKSMKIVGQGVQMGMNFPLTVIAKEPNLNKLTVDVQSMQIIEAFDGEVAWTVNPFGGMTEPSKMSEEETKEASKQMFQDALLDYKEKGHALTMEGTEEYEGTEVFKLKLLKADGDEVIYFFDSEIMIPVAVRNFMNAGQLKGQSVDTITSDYQEVNGVMVPFSMKQAVNGQTMLEMTATSVELNVPIADSEFSFPGN